MAWVVPILRRCNPCGFKFSESAAACPECGSPRDAAKGRRGLFRAFARAETPAPQPWVGRRPATDPPT